MFDARAGINDLRSAILRVTVITALALAISAAAMTVLARRIVHPLKSLVEATSYREATSIVTSRALSVTTKSAKWPLL